MSAIKFERPTVDMIRTIADDMRPADVAEVWASNHHTPLESLMLGWDMSDFSVVITGDDHPLVIIGVVKGDLLSGNGVVWMLGANKALDYKKEFFRQTKPVIDELLTICPRLCNMVHNKNTASIRWLNLLGFTIDEPVQHGPENELFHPFHLERADYV